jgi:hypothetical protein
MANPRQEHLGRFYALLGDLEARMGGQRVLATCTSGMGWARRGVYFFRERGEDRSDSGSGPRIVRVGTHALKSGSSAILWTRLSQHKGTLGSGGGNHRGSIFRLIVGTALIGRDGLAYPTWGKGSSAKKDVTTGEIPLEREVSTVVCAMPFLTLPIDDDPGPQSLRGYIERNSIALLSNHGKLPLDPPSPQWLGRFCNREKVRSSGLWNSNHVDESYDPAFLDELERLIGSADRVP